MQKGCVARALAAKFQRFAAKGRRAANGRRCRCQCSHAGCTATQTSSSNHGGGTHADNICNYVISSSRESRDFHFFATMPFLHFAKAGFPSSQTCLFFISRKQIFHLRKHAFSSFREIICSNKTNRFSYSRGLSRGPKNLKRQKGESWWVAASHAYGIVGGWRHAMLTGILAACHAKEL